MAAKRKIGVPTPEAIDDVWQRRATAAAILAIRDVIRGGTIPPATPISKLSDVELGWLLAAGLFAWINARAEQATAEGWDVEETLRQTSLNPQPWDEGAVAHILPQLGALTGCRLGQADRRLAEDMMVRFLMEALQLVHTAMIARDVGGGIATPSASRSTKCSVSPRPRLAVR